MKTFDARRSTRIVPFRSDDTYGKRTLVGMRELLTPRRMRRWAQARNSLYHRVSNGVFDPITMYHLADELANIQSEEFFSASDLTAHLNLVRPALKWDAVTVGRILSDMAESWEGRQANPSWRPLAALRRSTGRQYAINSHPAARESLVNLIDDLAKLGASEKEREGKDGPTPRLSSPLGSCRSLVGRRLA